MCAAAATPLPPCCPSLPCRPSHSSRRVIEIFTLKGVALINLVLVVYGLILVGFTSAMGVVQIVKLRKEVGVANIGWVFQTKGLVLGCQVLDS